MPRVVVGDLRWSSACMTPLTTLAGELVNNANNNHRGLFSYRIVP
jgi:hypothetical protein